MQRATSRAAIRRSQSRQPCVSPAPATTRPIRGASILFTRNAVREGNGCRECRMCSGLAHAVKVQTHCGTVQADISANKRETRKHHWHQAVLRFRFLHSHFRFQFRFQFRRAQPCAQPYIPKRRVACRCRPPRADGCAERVVVRTKGIGKRFRRSSESGTLPAVRRHAARTPALRQPHC